MAKVKFSNDPKVKLISIKEFYDLNDYLRGVSKRDLWTENTVPGEWCSYFKFTSNLLIYISYTCSFTNFGMDTKEKLEEIQVAYRDGITEYKLLEEETDRLIAEKSRHKYSKKLDEQIKQMSKVHKLFPEFKERETFEPKKFEDYLIDTGKKFDVNGFEKKIIVFDTETNGTRKSNDDLLSLSIYDPSTGICYNRYFPLDLQPCILTSFIHGITDKDLDGQTHWTQEEVDKIIEYFDLKNAFVLSYSGGQGTFDSSFVNNYCKRHKITGFEELDYRNIKKLIPRAPFGSEGQLTKDNLCRILKIEGVTDIHSSLNDCILEYQLFEKLLRGKVFFIQEHLYAYHPEYIIPVSYLSKHDELIRYANLELKPIVGNLDKVFEFKFPKKILKEIKKFPTNITGITIENGINHLLNAETQDNFDFLAKNKSHLEYLGSLDSAIEKIPVISEDDGTIKTLDSQYEDYVKNVNNVTKVITDNIGEIIDFIKANIFSDSKILSQELVISDDNKVLALCDLSDTNSVLEIKTMDVVTEDGYLKPGIARQVYFQKRNRSAFVLSVVFDTHLKSGSFYQIIDNVKVFIYKVNIEEKQLPPKVVEWPYMDWEIETFNLIEKNPSITQTEISKLTERSIVAVGRTIRLLKNTNVIIREGSNKTGTWVILKHIKLGDKYSFEVQPRQ